MNLSEILLCTVGTGNINKIEETLLSPLKKSIRHGTWAKVILLPSQTTLVYAQRLRDEVSDVVIEIKPLAFPKQEDDPDACFAHFDKVIADLIHTGSNPDAIVADFTRGTKAMSAALVLAAVRHGLPVVRYIAGEQRDAQGMVVSGTEMVTQVKTTIATARRRLDEAYGFFRHGNFAAALDSLPGPGQIPSLQWPQDISELATLVRTLAAFYAAWDRLDYKGAQEIDLSTCDAAPSPWDKFLPPPAIRGWVTTLAQPLPEARRERAVRLRLLVADLLANGERRLRDHQYEDAIIRGYRVLELVGQIRLFDSDLDSAELSPEHPDVKKFQEKLLKKKSHPLTEKDGKYQASREQVARLLKHLGEPIADDLLKLGNYEEGQVKLSRRNYSVWIHGFEAIAGSDPEPIRNLLKELENLLIQDGGTEAKGHLIQARWMDLSQRTK